MTAAATQRALLARANPITYRTALELASHEAIVRQAYKDSVGVWTWSVGLTNATGHVVTRYIGKPQTMEHCLRIYVWALEQYAETVRWAFAGHPLTEAQFAAALSFHYNTGRILSASWVKAFKAGDMAGAERALKSWNKAGGRVVPGLVTRRGHEADLFFRGRWSNNGTITEYTRVTPAGTPDWSSGRRVNIETDLRAALDTPEAEPAAAAPPPPVPTPRPRPEPAPAAAELGFWARLLTAVRSNMAKGA